MKQVLGYRRLLVAACVAVLLAGCGGGRGIKVEGKVLRDGKPYTPQQGLKLNLSLNGTGSGNQATTYPATVADDGSFVVDGPKGAGVPPGKYTINANLTPEGTDPDSLSKAQKASAALAAINGKECEVAAGRPITIDIGKGSVTQ
jgi:hypothetical protein